MLDLAKIDLSSLVDAMEDHSEDATWWLNPRTGEVASWSELLSSELDERHPDDRGLLFIRPVPSSEGYGDMEDFISRVPDEKARDLLDRAIRGRGAFRR